MAKFGFLLPREEMVAAAERVSRELDMDVVYNQWVSETNRVNELAEEALRQGADILVARGRQAFLLKQARKVPVVELRFTGQEVARLLHKARQLVGHIQRPKLGIVTSRNMVGEMAGFQEVLGVEIHAYFVDHFVDGISEMAAAVEQAMEDGMDVILGGDFVREYCHSRGWLTSPWEGTEDSIRTGLQTARNIGIAADAERKNTAHLEALLAYSFNGIIELSAHGVVTRINDIACKVLGVGREELLGVYLPRLLNEEGALVLEETLQTGKELYFSLLEVGGVSVVANAARVTVGDHAEGLVFSFYERRSMERQEARAIRERYRLHRYLARGRFEDVKQNSAAMRRAVRTAQTFAAAMQPILLQGEVGNGKSLFAQSIHNASPCAGGPFVTFICAGEDEEAQRRALCRAMREAEGGTLWLDGINRLKSLGQLALRRLLVDGVVQGEGDEPPSTVTARVIASVDESLYPMVAEGRFRADVYYVLAPMRVELPSLRTRPDDLDRAIDMCLDDCVNRLDRYVALTKEARRALLAYPWPGNYIQLRAFLERMVLTAPSRTVGEEYVRGLLESAYPGQKTTSGAEREAEERPAEALRLTQALERHNGNREAVAAELGISKTTLWRRMKRYGISGRYQ